MREWFFSREPRERVVLAIGAAATLLLIGYGLVWKPLADGSEALHLDVAAKSRLLVDLERAAAVAPVEQAPRAGSDQSLVVLVDRTAQRHGLAGALTRTRPDGTTGINVTLQNAAFDALLAWLITRERDHGVSVESASVTSSRQQGLVNGQLLLRRY
jgi:type II secretory pathway component PulM